MKHFPKFDPLFKEVVDYVKTHQGEKGYIDCQPDFLKHDIIYGFAYDEEYRCGMEEYIYGVRVCKTDDEEGYHSENDLEVILEPISTSCRVRYEDADFRDEDAWLSVKWSDTVGAYFWQNLLSIAECIEQYN